MQEAILITPTTTSCQTARIYLHSGTTSILLYACTTSDCYLYFRMLEDSPESPVTIPTAQACHTEVLNHMSLQEYIRKQVTWTVQPVVRQIPALGVPDIVGPSLSSWCSLPWAHLEASAATGPCRFSVISGILPSGILTCV